MDNTGMIALAAAVSILAGMACSIGEAWICVKAVEGISRNPENASKLRSTMIIACALVETCGIYALLISILIIFMLGMK
ncbi:MAG: ATP synthase F0 subunit C [Bacilli bacterium]|jgi:F-type H+-transporting ATPase subunit c